MTAPTPLDCFVELMIEFVEAMNDIFPECDKTYTNLCELREITQAKATEKLDKLVRVWHLGMSPHFAACTQCDDSIMLRQASILSRFDMKKKWQDPQFNDDSKEAVWAYINQLNKLSALHCETSPDIQTTLLGHASRFMSEHVDVKEDGTVSINPASIQRYVKENVTPERVSELVSKVMGGGGEDGEESGFAQIMITQFTSMMQKGAPMLREMAATLSSRHGDDDDDAASSDYPESEDELE